MHWPFLSTMSGWKSSNFALGTVSVNVPRASNIISLIETKPRRHNQGFEVEGFVVFALDVC
ncbi:hypothetical protein SNOG_04985 [Parastagonospora nodorum SN15]|uniref:Uncharacterized protein n=1 Tax=Phaeosphaeria nodorum (strain SN15 / ATCC MYA-4574 / FGSC 10173) TaxID=321614 RepID=Q0UTC9_PHANO|nr:hypothetical protein SNOG_04985 [Parastagonospora nodorum SN15]EAT87376.1 hypothetical protein SNOG_04985 [Parastagonospora nodorum SN15]